MKEPIQHSLENQFLIAMPQLKDSVFGDTVSVVCQHSEAGAIALVINKTLPQTLEEVFKQINLPCEHLASPEQAILYGGPVQPEAGFILHTDKGGWQSTLIISDALFLTSSKDILEAISQNKGPEHYRFILGYSGWSSGQIEEELQQNSWLHSPIESDIVFNTPPELIGGKVIQKLGINPHLISNHVGHA
ncbi:MAG: YqgE/AlgH family protein [Arenicellales bacterium]